MAIQRMDHFTILTKDSQGTAKFYNEMMGFTVGDRPNFGFPGIWLWNEGRELAALAPTLRPVPHGVAAHGWHLYPVLIDFEKLGRSRDAVMSQLRDAGIGTQVHYLPVHRQPYYSDRGRPELPGAEAYYARCLSLPFYTTLRDEEVHRVVTALTNIVKANA